MPGCRNERSGGESVQDRECNGGPYFTYLVYQSFKRPSDVKIRSRASPYSGKVQS